MSQADPARGKFRAFIQGVARNYVKVMQQWESIILDRDERFILADKLAPGGEHAKVQIVFLCTGKRFTKTADLDQLLAVVEWCGSGDP